MPIGWSNRHVARPVIPCKLPSPCADDSLNVGAVPGGCARQHHLRCDVSREFSMMPPGDRAHHSHRLSNVTAVTPLGNLPVSLFQARSICKFHVACRPTCWRFVTDWFWLPSRL